MKKKKPKSCGADPQRQETQKRIIRSFLRGEKNFKEGTQDKLAQQKAFVV